MFERRFRAGKMMDKSPMPWENFQEMSDSDLKAVYNFLRSLEPSDNKVEITFRPSGVSEGSNHQASARNSDARKPGR